MNISYQVRHSLKLARWRARRAATAIRWGAESLSSTPSVLGNAMPKSGSHLIIQVLQGLTRVGPFVNPGFPPVNRAEDNSKLPETAILENILRMQPGDIGYGYINASKPFVSTLTEPGRATVFVYRDPRDMIVSHIFYATEMRPGHWMHRYYTEELDSMEARINAAIKGVDTPGSELTPIRRRYEGYLSWLEQPEVLSLRFEDLILNRASDLRTPVGLSGSARSHARVYRFQRQLTPWNLLSHPANRAPSAKASRATGVSISRPAISTSSKRRPATYCCG